MAPLLQLHDFNLVHLSLHWHGVDGQKQDLVFAQGFDYWVRGHSEDPRRFALNLRMWMHGEVRGEKKGYEIESEIVGYFECPEQWDESQCVSQVRINGCLLLYGILRGHIADATGAFPGGKFVLPTVSIPEVLAEVDRQKTLCRQEAKSEVKASAKRLSQPHAAQKPTAQRTNIRAKASKDKPKKPKIGDV